jgi:methionine sulfoxide reductase heme-binding subunit
MSAQLSSLPRAKPRSETAVSGSIRQGRGSSPSRPAAHVQPIAILTAALASAAAAAAAEQGAGGGEPGIRAALRASARVAFLPYAAAFSASSLNQIAPSALSRQLLRYRRQLGLSFAAAQVIHAFHIRRLYVATRPERPVPPMIAALGSVAFAFMGAMAATSWDGAIRRMGPRRWRALHTVGGHFILGTFTYDFLIHAPFIRRSPDLPFGALNLGVWIVRARADRLGR